jgi:macrodomain Ter protein organizer (MatP/YcbG family)
MLSDQFRGGALVRDYPEITAKLSETLNTAEKCSTAETVENYSLLGEQLNELASTAGQSLLSHGEYQPLIDKLEKGSELTEAELKTVRSLIVGDADQYLKYSDDFACMKAELSGIIGQVEQLKSQDLDIEALMRLRVLCKEASSALVPTLYYLEQRDRVRRFEEHTHAPLSKDASHVLARIIKEMAR